METPQLNLTQIVNGVWLDLERVCKRKPHFLDIGAHTGKVSWALLDKFGPGARCWAFEPGEIGEKIRPKMGLIVHHYAVGTQDGKLTFYDLPRQSQSSSVFRRCPSRGGPINRCIVPSVSLDTLMWGFEHIDFMSMDIEGAEWDILREFRFHGFWKRIDQLCLELHLEFAGEEVPQAQLVSWTVSVLKDAGFTSHIAKMKNEADKRPILWACRAE